MTTMRVHRDRKLKVKRKQITLRTKFCNITQSERIITKKKVGWKKNLSFPIRNSNLQIEFSFLKKKKTIVVFIRKIMPADSLCHIYVYNECGMFYAGIYLLQIKLNLL